MLTHLKFFVFSCKNKKLEDIMQKALNFVEKASKRVCWLNCDGRTLFICIKRSRPRIYKDQGVILGGKLTFRLHLRKIIFSSKSIKTMHALRITTIDAFYILHLHCKEISKCWNLQTEDESVMNARHLWISLESPIPKIETGMLISSLSFFVACLPTSIGAY